MSPAPLGRTDDKQATPTAKLLVLYYQASSRSNLSWLVMLSAVSGCLQMPARKLGTFYAARSVTKNSLIQSRTMILIGSEKDSEKLYTSQMFDYANDIERMGCNDHPHFKRVRECRPFDF